MVSAVFLLGVLAVTPSWPHTAKPDTFAFLEIVRIPYVPAGRGVVVCGDADHDRRPELYLLSQLEPRDRLFAVEFDGLSFDTVFIAPPEFSHAHLLCDADCDGRTDLFVSDRDGRLHAYESADSSSLPLTIVWAESSSPSIAYRVDEADLDRDDRRDLVLVSAHQYVRRYEGGGPNSYVLKQTFVPEYYAYVQASASDDMDRDGWPELVAIDFDGIVHFWEAVANDSLRYVSACTTFDFGHRFTASAQATTPDMDGDGRPEVITCSNGFHDTCALAILEAVGSDRFAVVWDTTFSAPYIAEKLLAVGDIDGDSVSEFALGDGESVRVFRCVGPNSYRQVFAVQNWEIEAGLFDLTGDGRAELIVKRSPETVIYEYRALGIEEAAHEFLRSQLANLQSHIRLGASIRLPEGATVTAHDALGRVVSTASGTWNTSDLAPGTYFLRVSSGSASATRKVLVLP